MFCSLCAGQGQIMGNGMIMKECSQCDGHGDYEPSTKYNAQKINKRSKAYKQAIEEIMALNPSISRVEAAKMFEDTYDRV